MTKLLIILPSTQRGGTEEYALTIASAAVKNGWDVHAAFPEITTTATLVQTFEEKDVYYHSLNISEVNNYRFKTLKYILQLFKTLILLFKIQPDVVQINLPGFDCCFGSILACGWLRIPTLVVFHLFLDRAYFSEHKLKLYAWARARNQQWTAVSEYNRRLVSESFRIPSNEVLLIYNGVNTKEVDNKNKSEGIVDIRYQLRQEIGVPQNSILVLTVGRLHSQKGHKDLIPTIPYLIKDFPDLRFIWVGDGEEKENLVNQVRRYGVEDKVFFLGYRSDVSRLLKSADLFVFPTHFEGLPLAVLESMANNLPIITTEAASIPEVIEDKVHGLLCKIGDSCDLLEALRWALEHPDKMKQMSINAKLRVQEFSEDRMVQETLSILQKLSYTFPKISQSVVKHEF
ncbi:glycosyltransferase [Aetokthonos hydrillicola Thurmond2011]|jgi:glycosyltransferase involved in cell wall biosynthesis|uniref:Glycosyltransferase n=1 Tax=Aetokthonos hydrillicola Thurmond2011 TaxID=2712845 RepID=A0AAP5I2I1_9CYAN|nr:glycosyltransferase [Aetokthonos hydrillicola]MBO3460912.1 glycosyltransferase [Aetokthonos hydrillicola CCALA 1050]MBW4586461.1 glycosyltransferase [Aetokthonos hydrillicola CCALA 1050]MDR9893594.1 glycosyltransferase [Aetokthonos hydrillicola Thurmond2011]